MSINRREFFRASLLAGAGLMLDPAERFAIKERSSYFGIHPFILQNPDAVFIMHTGIDQKTNSSGIKKAGLDFGRSVFDLTDDTINGIPLYHKVVIKPNLTCRERNHPAYTILESMGIVTDVFFVEGIIESLKELGLSPGQFFIREVNCPDDLADGGYTDMAERTGIDLQCINTPAGLLSPDKVQWINVPDGVYFKRIPYLWPVNASDTFLINISKFKAHGMGLTLCAKNLQGTIAMNYQAHCTLYGNAMTGVGLNDINPYADSHILSNYNRHKNEFIPRWDKPGSRGGIWQETWASRCLDNNSVTIAGLHIIEGIYGRDGNFMDGPGADGLATDYMTNYIIFGRNAFLVDNIGHYLGGHEPGNFGLFHMALERGLTSTIDPNAIPVYKWDPETGAVRTDLAGFQRYPLKTYYLQRDYNGQTEPYWHMVDEPYNYSGNNISDKLQLYPNTPNPVYQTALINFFIPREELVQIEIFNGNGNLLEVLVNRRLNRGTHSVPWNSRNYPSGVFFCRLTCGGITKVRKMIVIH